MKTFLSVHQNDIVGHLTTFDRMIFRGHLTGFYPRMPLLISWARSASC